MIEIKAFACEHCASHGKRQHPFRSKSACRTHEKKCYRNPATRACATCALWELSDEEFGTRECSEDHQLMGVNYRNGEPTLVLQHDCPHWMPVVEVGE